MFLPDARYGEGPAQFGTLLWVARCGPFPTFRSKNLDFVASKAQFGKAGMVGRSRFGAGAYPITRLLGCVLGGDERDFERRQRLISGVPVGIANG